MQDNNLDFKTKISAYEQLICSNEDLNSNIDEHKKVIELLQSEKTKVEVMLTNSITKINNLEEKNFKLSKDLTHVERSIKARDEERELLKNYVKAIKTRTYFYLPTPDDIVDVKLAEHLNNIPDPQGLSALFMRESSGIYHFGTKRIFVKIENIKLPSMSVTVP